MLIGSYGSLYRLQSIYSRSLNNIGSLTNELMIRDSDNAYSLSASRMSSDAASLRSALDNIQTGVTYAQLAQDSYDAVLNELSTARTIAQNATSVDLSSTMRDDYQSQLDNILLSISDTKSSTSFNGIGVFGDGSVGTLQTYVQPTVLSGANNYVNISTNADISTLEVTNSSGSIIAHTVDSSHVSDGYYTVNFGSTNATVSFDSTELYDENRTYDVKEVTSGTTTMAAGPEITGVDDYAVISSDSDINSIMVFDSAGNQVAHSVDTSTASDGYYTVNFGGINDATVRYTTPNTTQVNIYNVDEVITIPGVVTPPPATYTVVYNQADLEALGVNENAILANDITLNASFSAVAGWGQYAGHFDGNGFTINGGSNSGNALFSEVIGGTVSNLTLDNWDHTAVSTHGFLAYHTDGATFDNISVINSNLDMDGGAGDSGGLVGWGENSHFSNIDIDMTLGINGSASMIGGIVGNLDGSNGSITNANVNLVLTSDNNSDYVGVLAGYASTGTTITNSHATGSITTGTVSASGLAMHIGGLVGASQNMSIADSSSAVTIDIQDGGAGTHGDADYVGGLVGNASTNAEGATITNSHATGNIKLDSGDSIGGIVGNTARTDFDNVRYGGFIYTYGVSTKIGGIAGSAWTNANISDSTTSGTIGLYGANSTQVGGLVGFYTGGGQISHSYGGMSITVSADSITKVGGIVGETSIASLNDVKSEGNINVISDNSARLGGIVGHMDDTSLIEGEAVGDIVFINSNLNMDKVGGIAGETYDGTIVNTYAAVDITFAGVNFNGTDMGGFIGYQDGTDIDYSAATGAFNSSSSGTVTNIGGFVGQVTETDTTSIQTSYARNEINMSNATVVNAGGFVGALTGMAYLGENWVEGEMDAGQIVNGGGFVGMMNAVGSVIEDSFVAQNLAYLPYMDAVSATHMGGFFGLMSAGLIRDSYTAMDMSTAGPTYVGAFGGFKAGGTITNSAFNEDWNSNGYNATGYGSSVGITMVTDGDLNDSEAPFDTWDTGNVWDINGIVMLQDAEWGSTFNFSSVGLGSTATTAGSGATMTRTWDPSGTADTEHTVHKVYSNVTDLVSITEHEVGFTDVGNEILIGPDNFYIQSLTITADSSGVLTEGTDYTIFKREGDTRYTLLVSRDVTGEDLQLDFTGSSMFVNDVGFGDEIISDSTSATNSYSQTSDMVSLSKNVFSAEEIQTLVSNFLIDDITISNGLNTTYERGVDYDVYKLDGSNDYTLEILNSDLLGTFLQVDFTGASTMLDLVTHQIKTKGNVGADLAHSMNLQVGIDSTDADRYTLSSFEMDLSEFSLNVSNSAEAENTVAMIDETIDYIKSQKGVADTHYDILSNMYDRREDDIESLEVNSQKIIDSRTAELQQELVEEQLNYQTALQMINFLAEVNYKGVTNLLSYDPTESSTAALFGISSKVSNGFINPLATIASYQQMLF